MDYEMFKKSLIRIAIMAQDQLGTMQEGDLLKKFEEETKKKNENRKKDRS